MRIIANLMLFGIYLEFVSFLIGCIAYRRSWPLPYRCLVWVKGLKTIAEAAGHIWMILTATSNHWIYNVYFPLQCAGLLFIFYKSAVYPKIRRFNGWLLAAMPVLFCVFWRKGSFYELNLMATVAFAFLLLLSSCAAFIDQLLGQGNVSLPRQPLFWLSSGILAYSVGAIVYYATWEYSKKMILFYPFTAILISTEYVINIGVIACFICLYLQRKDRGAGAALKEPA
jgi:predicted membrane channel-forming protein YqfA (hemolysin III family)